MLTFDGSGGKIEIEKMIGVGMLPYPLSSCRTSTIVWFVDYVYSNLKLGGMGL